MYPWNAAAGGAAAPHQQYQQAMFQQPTYYAAQSAYSASYGAYGQSYAAQYAQPYAAAPWQAPNASDTAEYNFEQPTTLVSSAPLASSLQTSAGQQYYAQAQQGAAQGYDPLHPGAAPTTSYPQHTGVQVAHHAYSQHANAAGQPLVSTAQQPWHAQSQSVPHPGSAVHQNSLKTHDPSSADRNAAVADAVPPPLPVEAAPPLPSDSASAPPPLPPDSGADQPPLPSSDLSNAAPPLPSEPATSAAAGDVPGQSQAQQDGAGGSGVPWQATDPAVSPTPWSTAGATAPVWSQPAAASGPGQPSAAMFAAAPQVAQWPQYPPTSQNSWGQVQYGGQYAGYPAAYAAHGYSQGPWSAPAYGAPSMTMVPVPTAAEPPAQPQVVVKGAELFHAPGRESRPRRIAIILRGLPGSGKSAVGRAIRDLEVAAGGAAPRVLSIDEYFMVEVEEEVEEDDGRRGKRRKVTVNQYQFDKDAEGMYKTSLLKGFQRTVEEGRHSMVVVDASNVTVDDFKPFWMAAQVAGYDVYIQKPLLTDPGMCAKYSTHGRSKLDVNQLASMWQDAPPLYTLLDLSDVLPAELGGSGAPTAARPAAQETAQEHATADVGDTGVAEPAEQRKRSLAGAALLGVDYDGSTDDDEPDPLADIAASSKWSALDEEFPADQPKQQKKRSKQEAAAAAAKKVKGILRKGVNIKKPQSVRWADQVLRPVGFQMSGATDSPYYQLEQVLELEGLGPPRDDGQDGGVLLSFQQQVSSEHAAERSNFRDILLARR